MYFERIILLGLSVVSGFWMSNWVSWVNLSTLLEWSMDVTECSSLPLGFLFLSAKNIYNRRKILVYWGLLCNTYAEKITINEKLLV